MPAIEGITSVLVAHREGRPGAFDQLVALVYPELRRIARRQLGRWRAVGSLDTGSLVNEAYLKLVDQTRANWQDRNHFFAIAATAMRQVIIDYARKRLSQKRGGGVVQCRSRIGRSPFRRRSRNCWRWTSSWIASTREEPRLMQLVECRFFAGYSETETADALHISTRTVRAGMASSQGVVAGTPRPRARRGGAAGARARAETPSGRT